MPDDAPCNNCMLVMGYGIGGICALHEHFDTMILTAQLLDDNARAHGDSTPIAVFDRFLRVIIAILNDLSSARRIE